MDKIQLTQEQVTDLARPFVTMLDAVRTFYADPINEKAYRKWHKERYGCYPKDEVCHDSQK